MCLPSPPPLSASPAPPAPPAGNHILHKILWGRNSEKAHCLVVSLSVVVVPTYSIIVTKCRSLSLSLALSMN